MAWLWREVQYENGGLFPRELEWRELFTWEGLTRTLLTQAQYALNWIRWRNVDLPLTLAACALALAWLFSTSFSQGFARLGLPWPRRIEFSAPLVATVPGLLYVWFTFHFNAQPEHASQPIFNRGLFTEALIEVLPLGLLYRGLVEHARWSAKQAVLALLLLTVAIPSALYALNGHLEGLFAALVASEALFMLLFVWILERWNRRLWCLVVLRFGTILTLTCIPSRLLSELDTSVMVLLGYSPYLLFAAWTLWRGKPLGTTTPP